MKSSETPFLTDWLVVSLRWLAVIGLLLSLSLGNALLAWPTLLLAGLVFWNVVQTVLTGLNRRIKYHRQISVGVDLLVAALFFVTAGGYQSPAFWIIFLPLMSASLYFEVRGVLVAVFLMSAVQLVVTLTQSIEFLALLILGSSIFVTIVAAVVFGVLSTRLIKLIRSSRQVEQEAQSKKMRVEHERLRAIYSLTSTLTGTLNYQRVLESVLDLSLSALSPDPDNPNSHPLVSAVLLFTKDEMLEIGSARRLTPADMRVTLQGQTGVLSQAIEQDKPILMPEVHIRRDQELMKLIAFRTCKEIYCFPLRSGFSAYGVLLFGYPEAGYFTPDRREILDILGRQAVVAIQNARLYQDIVDERERMIDLQEETRKKLARDLHDGPTQSVSAIAMRVNLLQRMLAKDPQMAREELARIEDLARRTTKEIRHMLFTLRPLVLESQGLVAALVSMAEKMKETYSQEVLIEVDEGVLKDMEMGKQSVIFYLVEEAVNNARKHARAPHIWVNLRPFESEIALLEIRDDGAGFDVATVNRSYDQRGSLGMVNLRERTELINGVLNLQSAIGKGTRVQVYIPLTEEAADRLHHATATR
jgi:signal transduction histidine kinase